MNVNMWESPLTQQNLGRLAALGRFRTVGPDAGELACGWVGAGRLIEPSEIVAAAARLLAPQDLAGRRVVVTAGPTFEPLDEVRFIGNRSSGKMGFALAAAADLRGAAVTLIAGPVALATPSAGSIVRQDVETAEEMRAALGAAAAHADVVVMAAAVADFRPATRAAGKLSRRSWAAAPQSLALAPNPDLLAELGRGRRDSGRPSLLVGFAAEIGGGAGGGGALVARAKEKLVEKGCDLVVANDVSLPGLGFGSDDNAVTLVWADGAVEALGPAPKVELADKLWDRLVEHLPGGAVRSLSGAPASPERRRRLDGGRTAAARARAGRRRRRA
jgi:phosphopantothenoylcysteine decarboxylase/phosphopantothenate--cysteine ligase